MTDVEAKAPDVSTTSFLEHLKAIKAPGTATRYAKYARAFRRLMAANGYESFEQLPPGMLGDFAVMCSNSGLNPSTVRVQVYAVKRYLDWVASRGVKVATQTKPELPRKRHQIRESLPQAQFSLYFRQADMDLEEPVRTAVMLLPCSGVRAQEIVTLKLDSIQRVDVKLKNGKAKKTLALRVLGKGNKERIVPLMEEGVEILTGYLAGWRKTQAGPWLFPKQSKKQAGKKPISDRALRLALQKLREPLGMDFTPHTMRRTYITMLWRKGIDLKTIAAIAGHVSIQTTIDHYIVMDNTDSVKALHNAGSSLTE